MALTRDLPRESFNDRKRPSGVWTRQALFRDFLRVPRPPGQVPSHLVLATAYTRHLPLFVSSRILVCVFPTLGLQVLLHIWKTEQCSRCRRLNPASSLLPTVPAFPPPTRRKHHHHCAPPGIRT